MVHDYEKAMLPSQVPQTPVNPPVAVSPNDITKTPKEIGFDTVADQTQ